jgi:YfiH family protein
VSPEPYASLNLGLATEDTEENVLANRSAFLATLDISDDQVAVGRLVHGNDVSVFREDSRDAFPMEPVPVRPGSAHMQRVFASDAVISNAPGMYFLLTCADCTPLAFRDRRTGAIGAAHGGWRGAALGIAGVVVQTMRAEFGTDPADLEVGIGPCIGASCYPVGGEVPATFRANGLEPLMVSTENGFTLDLPGSHEAQLRAAGVPPDSIESSGVCTSCNVSTYFSHRAEGGRTGRFALCIGLD